MRHRLELLKLIWRNWRATDDGDWYLSRRDMLVLRVKGSLCVLLGLEHRCQRRWCSEDAVGLAEYDYEQGYDYEFGRTWAWTTLKVGLGWRAWWYYELTDGGP